MMASNKISQAHFQRRHGRRTSIPASPTISDRRPGDRVIRGDLSSPIDTPSKSATGSPLIDWPSPSPAFDVPGFSSPNSANGAEDPRAGLWDRYNSPDPRISEDTTKSPSIGTLHPDGVSQSVRQSLPEAGFKSSPLSYTHRNGESNRTPDRAPRFYERAHMATRNISSTSLATEKSINDEQPSSKTSTTKKSRLNLLNPMSLLARRRSSQNSKLEDLNISPLHVPAIPDVDPSIRGKIVHDFSSPRIRTPRRDALPSPAQRRPSDSGGVLPMLSSPVLYSPVFKEHFQDEDTSLQPSQTSYLHSQPLEAPSPQALPAFAQKLPARLPSPEAYTHDSGSPDEIPHPELPPPPPPMQTPSPSLDPASAANIPKHTKSTSSRFSFQMAGQDSAQEKILEDKHRQHFANQPELSRDVDGANENEYDDFDLDAEDLEEDIPTAGFEDDKYDFDDDLPARNIEVQTSQMNASQHGFNPQQAYSSPEEQPGNDAHLPTQANNVHGGRPQLRPLDTGSTVKVSQTGQGFHFAPLMNVTSPPSTEYDSAPAARDSEGCAIGRANSQDLPTTHHSDVSQGYVPSDETPQLFFAGLKISTTEAYLPELPSHDHNLGFDDADLYFDDGEFDMEGAGFGGEFDEDMLDQESEQIRDIPAENARKYEAALQRSAPGEGIHAIATGNALISRDTSASSFAMVAGDDQKLVGATTIVGPASISGPESSGLTEGNLAAYHDALVMAANNAAASGKFNRQVSFSEVSVRQDDFHEQSSQADLVSDEGHHSLKPGSSGIDEESYGFDDDVMDDELMIAEANAEALENDDDGFYGQEFGFYARAHGKESSDLVNGGYFATRGFNGIKRSHSGKVNFQEPNLTPITERSEWSARNSVVSLQFHGGIPGSAHSLPSPGLSQIIDSPLLEDEMSLSALMRLRRGAFGGSSTSINSLAERNLPNSSPLAHVSTYTFPIQEPGSGRKLSMNQSQAGSMSIPESEEEDDDMYDRPTLTQNTPKKKAPELAPRTPYEQISSGRLSPQPSLGKKSRHSRNSSGAESVSYTQDDIGRWVLERKRTGDDGELEVIGREYLAGARI